MIENSYLRYHLLKNPTSSIALKATVLNKPTIHAVNV